MDLTLLQSLHNSLASLCGHKLPEEYLALLQAFPPSLKNHPRADDRSDREGVVSDVELLSRAEDILEINREARAAAVLDPEGAEFVWPDQLVVIGETGEGDYFCMDVSGEHSGVLQFGHQAVEFDQIADSLGEFIELLDAAYHTRPLN